ncbi:MAG: hypothetical protein D6681_11775 [Calditrichaeota bacterium]|nr:MAG: hypothetical protein D6681_11775 [Calditrichota bacterium]
MNEKDVLSIRECTEGVAMWAKMAMLWVMARLTWGEMNSPLYWRRHLVKFFPPPKKAVFKELLTYYFSRN